MSPSNRRPVSSAGREHRRFGRLHRGVVGLVALAGIGVALAGCGSSGPSGTGSGAGQQGCGGAAPVQTGVASVPVTITDASGSKLVTVGVCVGKHGPYSFVVDTGSTMSIIDSSLAGTLGLHRTGVTALGGMGCAQSGTVVSAPAMSMGHIPMAAQSLVSASLTNWAGTHVDGVLGSDVLGRFGAVKLDLEKASLTVAQVQGLPPTRHELVIGKPGAAPPASLLTTKPVVTVPMNVVYGPGTIAAYTNVTVMGHGPNAFAVDTGSPTTTLSTSLAASLQIASTGNGTPPGGIGCTTDVPTLGPTPVALGPASQTLSTLRSMPIAGEQRVGITGGLGLDFVVPYGTIIVDYSGADLTIAHG